MTGLWRAMTPPDLSDVERVASAVHPAHPEDAAVFRERLRLYPVGCFVLDGAAGIEGYVLSHPWVFGRPPSLNTMLEKLPEAADTFYLHDLALLPHARGGGAGSEAVSLIIDRAERAGFQALSLLAVGQSLTFWQRHGFRTVDLGIDLSSYGTATFMIRPVPQNPNM